MNDVGHASDAGGTAYNRGEGFMRPASDKAVNRRRRHPQLREQPRREGADWTPTPSRAGVISVSWRRECTRRTVLGRWRRFPTDDMHDRLTTTTTDGGTAS